MCSSNLPEHSQTTTMYGRVKHQFGDKLPIIQGGNILDAGCSVGATTVEISDLFPSSQVYGVDGNIEVLRNHHKIFTAEGWREPNSSRPVMNVPLREGRKYSLICAKAPELPFEQDFFKIIFNMNNIYNTAWKLVNSGQTRTGLNDLRRYFQEMFGFLEEDGFYLISGVQTVKTTREKNVETLIFRKTSKNSPSIESCSPNPSSQLELIIEANS